MLKLCDLLEKVDASKADIIRKGLDIKYGGVPYGKFGIELEWANSSDPDIDPNDYADEIIDSMIDPQHWPSNADACYEWIMDQRKSLNRQFWVRCQWDDTFGPIDPDDWETCNLEPERDDYDDIDDFNRDHNEWKSAKNDVEHDYSRWDWSDHQDEWARAMWDEGKWEEYTEFNAESDRKSVV